MSLWPGQWRTASLSSSRVLCSSPSPASGDSGAGRETMVAQGQPGSGSCGGTKNQGQDLERAASILLCPTEKENRREVGKIFSVDLHSE